MERGFKWKWNPHQGKEACRPPSVGFAYLHRRTTPDSRTAPRPLGRHCPARHHCHPTRSRWGSDSAYRDRTPHSERPPRPVADSAGSMFTLNFLIFYESAPKTVSLDDMKFDGRVYNEHTPPHPPLQKNKINQEGLPGNTDVVSHFDLKIPL